MSNILESLQGTSQELITTRSRKFPLPLNPESGNPEHQLNILEKQKLQLISNIINHAEFQSLIDEGKITYAMVRPDLTLGTAQGTDEEIFDQVKQQIADAGFQVILELPVQFDSNRVDEFYSEVKSKLETLPAQPGESLPGTKTIWESFSGVMRRGGTSVFILYDENADTTPGNTAWEHWRKVLGPTLPEPGSSGNLRADFGNRINNIGHGSDSIESVHRETRWLAQQLNNQLSIA